MQGKPNKSSEPSLEEELSPDDKFRLKWKETRAAIADVRKLFYDFYEMYDASVIDGNPKKKIPPRRDLQMQRRLYRAEAVRLGNICYEMLQSAYVQDGMYKRLRTELFED